MLRRSAETAHGATGKLADNSHRHCASVEDSHSTGGSCALPGLSVKRRDSMEGFVAGVAEKGSSSRRVDPPGRPHRYYEILGPLRVYGCQGSPQISARKMEILLVVLLIRSGQVVTINQL